MKTLMIPPTHPFSGLFHSTSQESFLWDTTCKCLPYLAPCPQRAMSALVTTWLGDTEPLRGRIVEPLHRPFDFCSQSRTQSPKIQQLWYQGSLCVNRPTMQIWFKDIFVMKLAWYFSSRSKFFDVGVSGRWEISSNSHGTFSVFKKRRKSFYQHFDHQFIQNHTTSFYFNTSQLLSIFLEHLKYLYCLLSLEGSGKHL